MEARSLSDRLRERFEKVAGAPAAVVMAPALRETPEPLRVAMAVTPCFSVPMLDVISPDTRPALQWVTRLADAGLLDVEPGALPTNAPPRTEARAGKVPGIALTSLARSQALQPFVDPAAAGSAHGDRALLAHYQRIADRLTAKVPAPAAVRRWAEFARHATNSQAMADRLDALVAAAVERRDDAELAKWIEAARPFAELLERSADLTMKVALQRAGRQLEILLRREADLRLLETFYPRREQIAVLEAFVRAPRERWLLHLLGSGGIGKTMLLRHLTIVMADAQRFLTARIDYDYLHPDYPARDPGLLLWAVGRELRMYDEDGLAGRRMQSAEGLLREIREEGRERPHGGRPRGPIDSRAFREALQIYIDAFRQLPRADAPWPIVLVLDTCEELVRRARSGPAVSDPVAATFQILGALKHGVGFLDGRPLPGEGLHGLKVVFSGRRPLASGGIGWTSDSELAPQPGLALYELTGFSKAEAREWLRDHLKVGEAFVEPVIAATPLAQPAAPIRWADGPRTAERGLNPYDLKHFADWTLEEPPPLPEQVALGSTFHYVELRILRRLGDPRVEQLLPAVVLLKYFDRDLLAAAVGDDFEDLSDLFERLVEFEWISRRVVDAAGGTQTREVFEIEEALRVRLWAYFSRLGVDFAARAGRVQERVLAQTKGDLEDVELFSFDAALRVLAADVERGRAWWRRVEEQAVTRLGFHWLLRLTSFLLGDGQAAGPPNAFPGGPPPHPLRGDVLAADAAARARTGDPALAGRDWEDVLALVDGRADDASADLRTRALAGVLAAVPHTDTERLAAIAARLDAAWKEAARRESLGVTAFAFVAGYEELFERLENVAATDRPAAVKLLQDHGQPLLDMSLPARLEQELLPEPHESRIVSPGRDLVAFAFSLSARACGLAGVPGKQRDAFDRACDLTRFERGRPFRSLDWTPPDDTAARVRVEMARARLAPSWIEERFPVVELGFPVLECPDHDRYWAAWLQTAARARATRLVADVDDNELLSTFLGSRGLAVEGRPVCNAHRDVPPAAIVAAQLAVERGSFDAGLRVLDDAVRQGDSLGSDVLRHVERAFANVAPRLRRKLPSLRLLSQETSSADAWSFFHASVSDLPPSFDVTSVDDRRKRLIASGLQPPHSGIRREALRRLGGWLQGDAPTPGPPRGAGESLISNMLRSEQGFRDTEAGRWPYAFGTRETAAILWEVGDLLAFAPASGDAEDMLKQAAAAFAEADDRVGEFACHARRAVMYASVPRTVRDERKEARARASALEAALRDAREAYEHIDAHLYRWPSTQTEARAWKGVEIDSSLQITPAWIAARGEWGPWLARMAICSLRLRRFKRGRLHLSSAERGYLGSVVPGSAEMLALLSFDPSGAEPPIVPEAKPSGLLRLVARVFVEAPRRAWKELRSPAARQQLLAAGFGLLGLLMYVGLFVGTRGVFQPVLGAVVPQYSGWPAPLAIGLEFLTFAFSLAAAFAGTAAAVRGIRTVRRRGTRFTLVITMVRPTTESPGDHIFPVTLSSSIPRFPFPGRRVTSIEGGSIAIEPRLASPARRWDAPAVAHLATWLAEVGSLPLSMSIVTKGSGPSRPAWEWVIASALGTTERAGGMARSRLHMTRGLVSRELVGPVVRSPRGEEVVVMTRQRSAGHAAQFVWLTSSRDRAVIVDGSDAPGFPGEDDESPLSQRSSAPPRVFHVIGEPVGTERDVRLRLSEFGEEEGRVEDAAHLARWAAGAMLCVVQASVVPRLVGRQASDRRDSENLREFASELHRHGVSRVVTVPPLTTDLAVTALRELLPATARSASAAVVLRAVASMRDVIAEGAGLPPDESEELAWNVCVFEAPAPITPQR